MPQWFGDCAEKWPEVSFAIEDIAAKDVVAKVQRGDIEFGLSGGEIDASELHIESLMRDPFLLVCRHDDALAEGKAVSWTKLSERRLVMLNNTSGSRQQIVDTLASSDVLSELFL